MNQIRKYMLSILFFTGCFLFSFNSIAQNWDINTLKSINPQNPNSAIMKGFTHSVYPLALVAPVSSLATGFIKHDKDLQHKAWNLVGALAVNTLITQGLKYTVDRQRPYEKYPGQVFPYKIETDASFPSGHTSTAFAIATMITLETKKWYVAVPAYAWATGVGYSRMYLGEHYPTDVIAGAAIGAGSAVLSHWLSKKILK